MYANLMQRIQERVTAPLPKQFYRIAAEKRGVVMGTWNSRGLRGSTLEDMINYTNTRYEEMGLALIQKVPTRSLRFGLTRNGVISHLPYLTRSAP